MARNTSEYQLWHGSSDISDQKITRKSKKLSNIFSFHQICLIVFFENPCEKITRKSSSPENHPKKSPDISPTKTRPVFSRTLRVVPVEFPGLVQQQDAPSQRRMSGFNHLKWPIHILTTDWGDVVKHVKKKVFLVIYSDFLVI